jgi:hypothetical protein
MASVFTTVAGALRHPAVRYVLVAVGAAALGHFVHPRRVDVPQRVDAKEEVASHAKVETKECTSHEAISYEYVNVRSGTPGCPDVIVPSPVVTGETRGGGSVAAAGGAADVAVAVDKPKTVGAVSRPDWRVSALVGVGPGGLSVGGVVDRRVLGPVSVGVFALVPLSEPGKVSVGGTLGVSW